MVSNVTGLVPPATVPLLQDTVAGVQEYAGQLEAWFKAMMDRVSQRFAARMRVATVVFAVALAFPSRKPTEPTLQLQGATA